MKKEIPVYLFTGFLGAGKTTFIQDTLESEDFLTEECTLFLVCEEGEVEYEPEKFFDKDIHIEVVDEEEKLTTELMDSLADKYDADAVPVEEEKPAAVKLPYLIRVSKRIDIKRSASASSATARKCPVGIYTIVAEQNGYGKLKSGAGWVKLSEVRKI